MRIWSLIKKFTIEEVREWKILIFTLIFGPMFIALFFCIFSNKQTTYKIAVFNQDTSQINYDGKNLNIGEFLFDKLKNEKNSDKTSTFKLIQEDNINNAKRYIRAKNYDCYIVIPKNFSENIMRQIIDSGASSAEIYIYGDQANSKYVYSSAFINEYFSKMISSITGQKTPLTLKEKPVVNYNSRTSFEESIPAAIFIGIIMILFTTAIALIREVDNKTIRRLQISKMASWEMIGAINITQVITGMVEILITMFLAFVVFNAKPGGSVIDIFLISVLACISVIPIGIIVASFSRTISDILIYGNIPYMILFIFSGAFQIPRLNILNIGGNTVAINDIFPTTPAMTAIKKVMDEGAKLCDVSFDIGVVIIVTIIYYIAALALFNKKHMKLS